MATQSEHNECTVQHTSIYLSQFYRQEVLTDLWLPQIGGHKRVQVEPPAAGFPATPLDLNVQGSAPASVGKTSMCKRYPKWWEHHANISIHLTKSGAVFLLWLDIR